MAASPIVAHARGANEAAPQAPAGPWPTRHGIDRQASWNLTARLRRITRVSEPSQAQWAMLGEALTVGDPLADDVADWLAEVGMAAGWPVVEAALFAIGQAPNMPLAPEPPTIPEPLRRFLQATQQAPAWLDPARLARGARFLQRTGAHGLMVLRDAALLAGYQASAINQTLVMTGALQQGAARRMAETGRWWLACTADGGMAMGAEGHRLTLHVRLMHAVVRRRLDRSPEWDAAHLGRPINQVDMQVTYLAFSVVQLLGLRMIGMPVTRAESRDVMHFWQYVGWLMGVDERFLCDREQAGRISLFHNLLSQAPADETSKALAQALVEGRPSRASGWWANAWHRWERARQLSLVSWFVGAQGLRNLGLPRAWPWYPLLLMAPLALYSVGTRLPGLRRWARLRARVRQEAYLGVGREAAGASPTERAEANGCPRL